MKPLLFSVCFVLAFCSNLFSQSALKGRVIFGDNKKPVALANVFLSNTVVGTVTDDNGEFTIASFPEGRFDLVVSFVGYETYKITVQSGKIPALLEIVLEPKVTILQEVIVEPYEKDGWNKWGRFFLDNFIGTSIYARNCKLLNKDAVKFRFSKRRNMLYAFADEALVIENGSLGYRVRYNLTRFEFDFNTRMFYYQGYPFFEELNPKAREGVKRRWENNREQAYTGSITHFMRSLYRNRIIEEGFHVKKLIKVPDQEKKRVKALYQSLVQNTISSGNVRVNIGHSINFDALVGNKDSAEYYRKVLQSPQEFDMLVNKLLPGDSIAFGIDNVTAGLLFEDHLQVIYPAKRMPAEYFNTGVSSVHKTPNYLPIESEISLIGGVPIHVLANGSYYEGINLLTEGYWALSEKIGNMLPYDYWPSRKKKK